MYPRDENKPHIKAAFFFFFFTKLMKILQCNGGIQISNYLAIIIKRVIIIKRDAKKLAVLWRTVTTGAKMPQAMLASGRRMLPAKGQTGARFNPTKPQPRHGGTASIFPRFGGAARARR